MDLHGVPFSAPGVGGGGQGVLPGDCLNDTVAVVGNDPKITVFIGRGLTYRIEGGNSSSNSSSSSSSNSIGMDSSNTEDNKVNITATMAGSLRFRKPGDFWVENSTSRLYDPAPGDKVVGVVVTAPHKGGDFMVNIRSGSQAVLRLQQNEMKDHLDLKKGAVLYCQVTSVPVDMDVELSCDNNKVFGVLKEGLNIQSKEYMPTTLIYVPLSYTRYLLDPNCVLLRALSAYFAYEVTIGANGVIWAKASSARDLVVIRNCLLNCQNFDDKEIPSVVDKLVSKAGVR